jgi:membrane protein YqaA with SNARE-associated domain
LKVATNILNAKTYKEKLLTLKLWRNERLLKMLAITFVIALIVIAIVLSDKLPDYRSIGYIGVFVLSFVGSASIFVPVPGIAAVCAGPSLGLFPLWVALLASIAEAIGEMSGYLVGFSGRSFAENNRFYPRVERWMQQRGWIALLLASSIPNPLFDFIGIAAGTLRYPVILFLASVWAGKMIKSTSIVYACFYGIDWALKFIGLE